MTITRVGRDDERRITCKECVKQILRASQEWMCNSQILQEGDDGEAEYFLVSEWIPQSINKAFKQMMDDELNIDNEFEYMDMPRPEGLPGRWPTVRFFRVVPAANAEELLEQPELDEGVLEAEDEGAEVIEDGLKERDLHPVLTYYAKEQLGVHCRTIIHQEGRRRGGVGSAEWAYPDIIGMKDMRKGMRVANFLDEARDFQNTLLYSFELKFELTISTFRKSFFQALSNSGWAHYCYLVVPKISGDANFKNLVSQFSTRFGVGIIELFNNDNIPQLSPPTSPARFNSELDYQTMDHLADIHRVFRDYFQQYLNYLEDNHPMLDQLDWVDEPHENLEVLSVRWTNHLNALDD